MATIETRTLSLLAALAFAAPVAGEDVFSLLEPDAYRAHLEQSTESEGEGPAGEELAPVDYESESPLELIPAPEAEPLSPLARPIGQLSLNAAAEPQLVEQMEKIPEAFAIKDAATERFGAWGTGATEPPYSRFAPMAFHFAAPAVYSRPLYFEQPNVERYGHYVGVCRRDNLTQSAISAAHFFATVPVLPYKMGANCPDECNYVLGAYRPGSCNPHQLVWPEFSLRGLAFEGAAVTGLIFLIP